jgi:hypothetical protein
MCAAVTHCTICPTAIMTDTCETTVDKFMIMITTTGLLLLCLSWIDNNRINSDYKLLDKLR